MKAQVNDSSLHRLSTISVNKSEYLMSKANKDMDFGYLPLK